MNIKLLKDAASARTSAEAMKELINLMPKNQIPDLVDKQKAAEALYENAIRVLDEVDDLNVRNILTLRHLMNLTWDSVAKKMGNGYTADSVKQAAARYLKKHAGE